MSVTRVVPQPRTFWEWLRGKPKKPARTVVLAWRHDDSPLFAGEPDSKNCAWCALEWCSHTTEAHRIQLVKSELRRDFSLVSHSRLMALEQAEKDFS